MGDLGSIPGLGRSPGEGKGCSLQYSWASLVVQLVKNPPAVWETWVQSLGWEDPLEKGKATHSSILAWRIPMDRGAWQATAHGGHKESDTTEQLSLSRYERSLHRVVKNTYLGVICGLPPTFSQPCDLEQVIYFLHTSLFLICKIKVATHSWWYCFDKDNVCKILNSRPPM